MWTRNTIQTVLYKTSHVTWNTILCCFSIIINIETTTIWIASVCFHLTFWYAELYVLWYKPCHLMRFRVYVCYTQTMTLHEHFHKRHVYMVTHVTYTHTHTLERNRRQTVRKRVLSPSLCVNSSTIRSYIATGRRGAQVKSMQSRKKTNGSGLHLARTWATLAGDCVFQPESTQADTQKIGPHKLTRTRTASAARASWQ